MDLKTFLDEHRTTGDQISHTGLGSTAGKYFIPEEDFDEFWKIYTTEVFDNKQPVHLVERHAPVGPIVIDLDFRYTSNTTGRSYSFLFLESIVKIYNEVILQVIDLPPEEIPESLQAFIFERPSPYHSKGVLKDGIHIMYPFLITEPAVQFYIRDLVLKHKDLDGILSKLPLDTSQTPSNIIDRQVIWQNGWFLYGACKPNLAAYKLTRILDAESRDCPISDYPDRKLPELLSIRNKKDPIPYNSNVEQFLVPHRQRIQKRSGSSTQNPQPSTSNNPIHQHVDAKNGVSTWITPNVSSIGNLTTVSTTQVGLHDEELNTIIELVGMLSKERCDNYDDWIRVGWALHNISPDSEELLLIWDEFSRKSSKYDEDACERAWLSMRPNGLGIGSLHFWARSDSPEEYSELRARDLRHWLMNSLSGTHVDVAKVAYRLYRYEFVCSSIRYKTWYAFQKHCWKEMDGGIILRNKIPNDLLYEYQKIRANFFEKIQQETKTKQNIQVQASFLIEEGASARRNTNTNGGNSGGDLEQLYKEIQERIERYREDITAIDQLIPKLKTTTFIDNVMKECLGMFFQDGFQNQLDANPYLLGFENGVYELQSGIFREGRPEDFISLSTGIYYKPFDATSEHAQGLALFLSQIQPNPEDRDYLLTFLASCLEGTNADESLHIWTGKGGNGKSKLNELTNGSLGSYAAKLPITLLTGKRAASNAANPEVMDTRGRRFCYLEEPSEGEQINVGFMKELTGGDRIKARGLYRDFTEFKPQFKMVLLCNDLPNVPPFDEGTWRRLKVLEFRSKFVDNPRAENEFPRDRYLSEKLIIWRETFMGLLLQYYQKYRKAGGLQIPQSVIQFTKEYQKGMDQYHEFIDTRLEFTKQKEDRLDLDEFYNTFQEWYERNVQSHRVPSKREVKKYLEKKFGKGFVSPSLLFGFRWKEIQDE